MLESGRFVNPCKISVVHDVYHLINVAGLSDDEEVVEKYVESTENFEKQNKEKKK